MFSSNIFQLGLKELRGLARDPMLLLLIVYAFSLQIYTGSSAMPETLNNAAVAIVDEDQSPLSGRISTAFMPPYFVPPKQISIAEMDSRMDAGLDTFALNIPPDFPARCPGKPAACHPAQCRCDAHEPGLQRQRLYPDDCRK